MSNRYVAFVFLGLSLLVIVSIVLFIVPNSSKSTETLTISHNESLKPVSSNTHQINQNPTVDHRTTPAFAKNSKIQLNDDPSESPKDNVTYNFKGCTALPDLTSIHTCSIQNSNKTCPKAIQILAKLTYSTLKGFLLRSYTNLFDSNVTTVICSIAQFTFLQNSTFVLKSRTDFYMYFNLINTPNISGRKSFNEILESTDFNWDLDMKFPFIVQKTFIAIQGKDLIKTECVCSLNNHPLAQSVCPCKIELSNWNAVVLGAASQNLTLKAGEYDDGRSLNVKRETINLAEFKNMWSRDNLFRNIMEYEDQLHRWCDCMILGTKKPKLLKSQEIMAECFKTQSVRQDFQELMSYDQDCNLIMLKENGPQVGFFGQLLLHT